MRGMHSEGGVPWGIQWGISKLPQAEKNPQNRLEISAPTLPQVGNSMASVPDWKVLWAMGIG